MTIDREKLISYLIQKGWDAKRCDATESATCILESERHCEQLLIPPRWYRRYHQDVAATVDRYAEIVGAPVDRVLAEIDGTPSMLVTVWGVRERTPEVESYTFFSDAVDGDDAVSYAEDVERDWISREYKEGFIDMLKFEIDVSKVKSWNIFDPREVDEWGEDE